MLCFKFQIIDSSSFWGQLHENIKPDKDALIKLLIKSRADSTVKRYSSEISKYHKWCNAHSVVAKFPVDTSTAVTYANSRFLQSHSSSATVSAHATLKWLHSFTSINVHNPFDHPICRNLLETIKRSHSSPIKKLPVSPRIIQKIVDKYGQKDASLADLRLACICSIGYSVLLRYNELSNIRVHHIEMHEGYIKILIPQSKTDVYREGNYIFIKRPANQYCPVSVLERYIQVAEIDPGSNLHLFRPIRWFKSIEGYKLCGSKLSYTRCREIFKQCLDSIGYDSSLYGLHSLRAGGATAAVANNPNLSERMLKLNGRWKSSTAKDMYIQEDITKRLEITNYMGL